MARIISNISSLATEVRSELRGSDSGDSEVSAEKKTENKGGDRWERATSMGRDFVTSLPSASDRLLTPDKEVTQAVAGPIQDGATEAITTMTQWFEPGQRFLDDIKQTRVAVQTGVRDEIDNFDSDTVRQTLEQALSPRSDLQERIEERLRGVVEQRRSLDPEDFKDLEIGNRAEVADRINGVLNSVADAAAERVLERREGRERVGGALHSLAEFGAGSEVEEKILDVFGTPAHMANTSARWALSTMAYGAEMPVKVAEVWSENPGLPTTDNFDKWVTQIEPGDSLVVEGHFLASITSGVGAKVGAGGAFELARSEEEPNRMTLTIAEEAEGWLAVGKEAQEQGGNASMGGRVDGMMQFDFDMSQPEHRELLAEVILANQLGVTPIETLRRAEGHLTRGSLGAEGLVDAHFGVESVDLSGESGVRGQMEVERRADGDVSRLALGMSGELSFGSFVQFPGGMVDALAATAPDENLEKALQLLGDLSGGRIGTAADVEGQLMAGMEWQEGQVQTLFVEGTLEGRSFGLNREVELELAIHEVGPLMEAAGLTPTEVIEQMEDGEFDLERLYEAAQHIGADPSEIFGLKVTDTAIEDQGFRLEALGLEFGATRQRESENTLLELGTPIDRSKPELEALGKGADTQNLMLNRPILG